MSAAALDGTADLLAAITRSTKRARPATAAVWEAALTRTPGAYPEVRSLVALVVDQDGGKYLRPQLAAAAFHGLGGDDDEVIDAISAALQCLHLALCIHDDLIDEDERRHGRFNVAGTVRRQEWAAGRSDLTARRQGTALGLLAGDLALSTAVRTVLRGITGSGWSDPTLGPALTGEMLTAIEDSVVGEVLDVRAELAPLNAVDALAVARLKTAGYSLILPLRLGAVAAGRNEPELLEALSDIGRHLGIAYQLVDDQLGLFGDPERTGKSNLSDLREGKRTEIIHLAWDLADEQQRALLTAGVGAPALDEAMADRLKEIVVATGAHRRSQQLIEEHTAAATTLARRHLPAPLAEVVTHFGDRSAARDH